MCLESSNVEAGVVYGEVRFGPLGLFPRQSSCTDAWNLWYAKRSRKRTTRSSLMTHLKL